MKEKPAVWWAYNDFGFYHPVPLAGKRAEAFIAERNQEKGGRWTLHTPEQYDEWFQSKGKFLEAMKFGIGG